MKKVLALVALLVPGSAVLAYHCCACNQANRAPVERPYKAQLNAYEQQYGPYGKADKEYNYNKDVMKRNDAVVNDTVYAGDMYANPEKYDATVKVTEENYTTPYTANTAYPDTVVADRAWDTTTPVTTAVTPATEQSAYAPSYTAPVVR